MILITGGLGFVGLNVTQEFLKAGKDCVLTQHANAQIPDFLKSEVGKHIFIEPVDVTDAAALAALGKKYDFEGIVHLAGIMTAGHGATTIDLYKDVEANMQSVASVIAAAKEWGVQRVTIASALGVYNGITETPWREDTNLPLTAMFPIEAFKKCDEILASYLGTHAGVECITMRFAAMYGPLYDASRGSLVGRLVNAALKGEKPNLEGIRGSVHAADGIDQCYVKDAARAVVLLQTAGKLNHQVYNVAGGAPITNQQIADAVRAAVPEFSVELPEGHMPGGTEAVPYQDITWLREDTGYEPQYSFDESVADYVNWLRAGHER